MMNIQTGELLQMLSSDDRKAFDTFYHLYYKQVFRFVYYHLKNTSECREVVTNVFFSIWKSRSGLTRVQSIEAYLYVVARNEVRHYQMQKTTVPEHISTDDLPVKFTMADEGENPEEAIVKEEIEELISQIIDNLPEKCRLIFLMNRNEGLKNGEIARRLSISESTVRVQMKIAIEKIVAQIKVHYPHLRFVLLIVLIFRH